MKYARIDGVVTWQGGTTVLNVGLSADDDHPLVQARPDLFTDEAPEATLRTPPHLRQQPAPVVERATAAPGEQRVVAAKKATTTKPTGGK